MKRYFKVHFNCFDDLSYESVLLYEIIVNNISVLKDTKKVDEQVYSRFANHIINKYVDWSSYKIKSLFNDLELNEYVKVLLTKKQIQSVRYVHLNKYPKKRDTNFYCFYDYIQELGLDAGLVLSYLIYEWNVVKSVNQSFEVMDEHISCEWSKEQKIRTINTLIDAGYIELSNNKSGWKVTDKFKNEAYELEECFEEESIC